MGRRIVLAVLLFVGAFAAAQADYRLECPSRDIDRAIRGCTVAIGSRAANLPEAYASRCVALWLKGAYVRATADCDQAIGLGANFAATYYIRGIGLAEKGDHHAAIADYSRSLELTPTTSAYYNRGTSNLALGDYAAALADFDSAIAGHPAVPQAHINRALALLASDRSTEVTADLDRALQLLHGDPKASAVRREILDSLGRAPGNWVNTAAMGAGLPAAQAFPLSKVLPTSISLESFAGRPLRVRPGPALALPPHQGPSTEQKAEPRAAVVAGSGAVKPRDSFAECVRLWNPETRTSLRQWNDICRRLDFASPGARRH